MLLKIISPTSLHHHEITSLELDILTGNIVIQEGHAPALMVLKPDGKISWLTTNGNSEHIRFHKGIVEIQRNHISIVIDQEIL